MKILVLTFWNVVWTVEGSLSGPNKEEYARLHGYDYKAEIVPISFQRHCAWEKIPAILKYLPDYDWVFHTEADSIITNKQIKLESFIDDRYDLIMPGFHGQITVGNFLARNTPWTQKFFQELNQQPSEYDFKADWDETVINLKLQKEPELLNRIKVLPMNSMNSLDWSLFPYAESLKYEGAQWKEGDFILHLARTGPERIKLMQRALKEKCI